jgi:Family of unknown function (DUF5681)
MSGDYEVGFCRPPQRTQWKKGQSGHPGRRKIRRAATTAEIIDKLLLAPINITENNITRRATVMEAIGLQLWKKALDGHPRAADVLLQYQELAPQDPHVPTEITFGTNPYDQNSSPAPSSGIEDDGQV